MFVLLTNMARDVLAQQLKDGLVLLVLGMGTVFIFLIILIACTKLMGKICGKFAKPVSVAKAPVQARTASPAAISDDASIAVAIAAAYDKER